jgi:hypothetical protein
VSIWAAICWMSFGALAGFVIGYSVGKGK